MLRIVELARKRHDAVEQLLLTGCMAKLGEAELVIGWILDGMGLHGQRGPLSARQDPQ
jgi:hypothetical protein